MTWPWASDLRPLSARSVALSMLLGAQAPSMSNAELTSLGELFGINPATMRVALSRMTGSGDLVLTDGEYSLNERHLARQAVTESLIHPRVRPYDGRWRMVIVVERGRSLERRTALRSRLREQRFGELREGTWLRPDNLDGATLPPAEREQARTFTTVPDDDRDLCGELWDLDGWAAFARHLLEALGSSPDPMQRLAAAAAAVRHLCTDPVLPLELAPERWPADELRDAYEVYRADLTATLTQRAAPLEPAPVPALSSASRRTTPQPSSPLRPKEIR